jgi:phosphomannomutase
MITGSHIPFDRNGYKLYTSQGELLKTDEAPINASVEAVRAEIYAQPFEESLFDASGMFREEVAVPSAAADGAEAYVRRYTDFFGWLDLRGRRVAVFEHSAVGRDVLKEVLATLGAEVVSIGRSDTFVPVDTENIEQAQLDNITSLVRQAVGEGGPVDVVLSTDGDSDRPLLLAWDAEQGKAIFYPGDLLGMVTAEAMDADAVVVPITCNDGIDRGPLGPVLEPRTRVGSPFVIEGMNHARATGKERVCAWEANGGFLLGSDIERNGRTLTALATRDALLPLISVVAVAAERGTTVQSVFAELPPRYTSSRLLRDFPREVSNRILSRFAPEDPSVRRVSFAEPQPDRLEAVRAEIESIFNTAAGFGRLAALDYTDGLRMYFENGDVAHVRPSGNAEELRIYAASGTVARAAEICELGVAEPAGLLRQLEALVAV